MDGEIQPYIIVLRKLFHDDLWTSEKCSKGQAWLDLFAWAYHSDGNFKWDGRRYNLKRGQLCHTEKFLCNRWKWSRNKLRRTFKKWQEDGMITLHRLGQRTEHRTEHRTAHPRNVITICNYDKIQFTPKANGTLNGTLDGTLNETQTEHKRINYNNKLEINNFNKSAPARGNISEKQKKKSLKLINKLTAQYERDKEYEKHQTK